MSVGGHFFNKFWKNRGDISLSLLQNQINTSSKIFERNQIIVQSQNIHLGEHKDPWAALQYGWSPVSAVWFSTPPGHPNFYNFRMFVSQMKFYKNNLCFNLTYFFNWTLLKINNGILPFLLPPWWSLLSGPKGSKKT